MRADPLSGDLAPSSPPCWNPQGGCLERPSAKRRRSGRGTDPASSVRTECSQGRNTFRTTTDGAVAANPS
jgi:hypothetical protein